MNRTTDTAAANFMTDHGSIRLTLRRARRGPRAAAALTVLFAARTASATRAAPTAALRHGRLAVVSERPPDGRRVEGAVDGLVAAAAAAAGGAEDGRAAVAPLLAPAWPSRPPRGPSGGGGMPGARVNFGDDVSAGTVARPMAARAVAGVPRS